MRTAGARPSLLFLLLLGVVLGVWPLLHASPIDVVLASSRCYNDTGESMLCNYTDVTDEVALRAYPDDCKTWKTLKLTGAKRLNVTVSCFTKIIVSFSNELRVTVREGEEKENPERSLHILDSNVPSLEGSVGRLYINRSNVLVLNASHLTDLDIEDSSVGTFVSVLNTVHDCLLSNTSIKSLDRLVVSGGKRLRMVDCHVEVLNKLVHSLPAISEIEGGAIRRIVKGGLEVKGGHLVMSNVSIGSLEEEAIVAADDSNLDLAYCSVNEAVVDSVSLRDGGRVSLIETSVMGEQLSFHINSEAEVYPFSLSEQFSGFSTASMVGSGFLGAMMALLLALVVFVILKRRRRRGPCESSLPGKKTHLISKSSSDDDTTTKPPESKPPPFDHDVRLNLPPPPAPPTDEDEYDDCGDGDPLPYFGQRPLPLPPLGGLGRPPQPDLPPPRLGTPPKPPTTLPRDPLPKKKNPFLPATPKKDDLPKDTFPLPSRGPFSFKRGRLELESSTKVQGSFLHGDDRGVQEDYNDTGQLENYDDVNRADNGIETYDDVNRADNGVETYDDVSHLG